MIWRLVILHQVGRQKRTLTILLFMFVRSCGANEDRCRTPSHPMSTNNLWSTHFLWSTGSSQRDKWTFWAEAGIIFRQNSSLSWILADEKTVIPSRNRMIPISLSSFYWWSTRFDKNRCYFLSDATHWWCKARKEQRRTDRYFLLTSYQAMKLSAHEIRSCLHVHHLTQLHVCRKHRQSKATHSEGTNTNPASARAIRNVHLRSWKKRACYDCKLQFTVREVSTRRTHEDNIVHLRSDALFHQRYLSLLCTASTCRWNEWCIRQYDDVFVRMQI